MNKEICFWSATKLASQIKNQQISIEEVALSYLNQIEQFNPKINAISHLRSRIEILTEAREKDNLLKSGQAKGSLFGVPVTIKESFLVKGLRTSNGDPMLRNYVANQDAALVKQLKEAGAIILGMTNVPLFCIDWQSTNFWNGQTNNPYDLTRVAGGSSGGSAAAVAARFSPLSIGSDAGGSIRVPAHFCGIYGLRPTEHLLSNRGHLKKTNKPQGRRNIVVPGPFANNITDLTLMMEVLANSKDYPYAEIPDVPFNNNSSPISSLNIAVSESINNTIVDEEYLDIFRKFIHQLKIAGHTITTDHPTYNEQEAYLTCSKIIGFEMGVNSPTIPFMRLWMYLFIRLKYKDHLWAKGMALGQKLSNKQYAQAMDMKDHFADQYNNFLSQYDIWLTPVCSFEAYKHQRAGKPFLVNKSLIPYTKAIASFNFTTAFSGHPIAVIPIGKKQNGMPVGIQIHAKRWTDKRLLDIANYFEQLINKEMIPKLII